MNAVTHVAKWPPPRNGGEVATREALEALAGGRCSPAEFLREILERFRDDRNGKWEVLSLLDQYYRRGKIKVDVFQMIKSRLGESALGVRDDLEPVIESRPAVAVAVTVTAPAGLPPQDVPGKLRPVTRSAPREVTTGDVLRGRYRIQEVLGHGGMGTVFGALDEYRLDLPETGQRVAVKVLHTAVTQRAELVAELQREFQHLQLLSHPNIVRVHEFDRDGDTAFFTMEALSGMLLGRVLDARQASVLPRPYALAIIREVGAALSHAHARGVVHGDINPHNVFLTNDGELRVLDFGTSHKILERSLTDSVGMSVHAPFVTAGYASCQLLAGQLPDARDDLFAFACLTYVLLTGAHPFPNRTAIEAAAQRWKPSRPRQLTGRQWRTLQQGLEWDREKRPRDVQDWLNRFGLTEAAANLPPLPGLLRTNTNPKRRFVLAAMGTVFAGLLIGVGVWAFTDYDSMTDTLIRTGTFIAGHIDNLRPTPAAPAHDRVTAQVASPSPAAVPVGPRLQAQDPTSAAATAQVQAPAHAQAPAHTQAPARAAAIDATAPTERDTSNRAGSVPAGRLEMAADSVDVPGTEKIAQVIVRRRGSTRGATDFTWWTESGTAKPGVNFMPVTPRVEHFEAGRSTATLSIAVADHPRSQPKSFYVVIDKTESGAAVGARTLTMVTLLPPE